jgi:predicted amidohydrolase YtcJ
MTVPSLAALSRQLAHWGVTAVTDAGAQNGPAEAAILAKACRDGELVQRLTMMGREDLLHGDGYVTGPVKLLFDERDFPDPMAIAVRIETARRLGRPVAAHCVTEAELVFYLAALDLAGGPRPGDRIEHGSLIPRSLIGDIAAAQFMVVANPGFIAKRGDRYLAEIEAMDLPDLHRLASLADAGIRVLAGSDAPYGPPNPWILIRAAINRKAPSGVVLGADEAVEAKQALALLASHGLIKKGACADCCLVDPGWEGQLEQATDPNPVQLSLIGGVIFNSRICSRGR